jgi:drug/metabolite transporter (DMT)-like permease
MFASPAWTAYAAFLLVATIGSSAQDDVANATGSNESENHANASTPVVYVDTSESSTALDQVLTDGILNGISLAVGLVIIMVARQLPMLGGGSLVFALFLAMVMKSGQEENQDVSQWTWWPLVVLLLTVSVLGLLVFFLRRILTAALTGVVFAVAALSIAVVAALPFLEAGLPAAGLLFALGCLLGWMLSNTEKSDWAAQRWFYIVLCALIGSFLFVDGLVYFICKHDLAKDIARSVLRAREEETIARDARPVVISWLASSAVLPAVRPILFAIWERHKPNMFDRSDSYDSSSLKTAPGVIGRGGDQA